MLPAAVEAMTAHLGDVGNPSSLHASGRAARRIVEESRETIAQALNCRPGEVVFTSGGTEADNLALKGLFWSRHDADPARVRILASSVEHHAVLDALHWLAEEEQAEVELLAVDSRGRLDVDAYRATVERDPGSVAAISVMWANNEVGTVQPIEDVVAVAAAHGIPVHTDAVQAVGAVPVDFAASGVDALTLTGHKLGGPYGVGALVLRRELSLTPLLHGGGQERDIRSGTLDMPAIAGFATAVEHAVKAQPEYAERMAALRDDLVRRVDRGRARRPPARRSGEPAARQRPPRLPRLRGRLAADAARRPRHRVLDRLGLLGRRARSRPTCCWRWASTTRARATRCGSPSAALRPSPTSTRSSRRSARPSSAPGGRGSDEGRRCHVRRRRLGRGRRSGARGRPRRHRHPPRALAQPRVVPLGGARLLHDRGRERRAPGGRRDRHPVLRLGPLRALPRRRGRGLHGRVRRRAHAQPVPALQREDQVRGRPRPCAGAGLRRGRHRSLRPGTHRRRRHDRAPPGGRRRQGPVLRARRAHPGAARALALPAR